MLYSLSGDISQMNIVIVGAGYSGVLTAKKLAKKFKKGQQRQYHYNRQKSFPYNAYRAA
jgi:NADH dehydrogenase FAD-containing subunit